MQIIKNKTYNIVLSNKDSIQTNFYHEVLFICEVLTHFKVKYDVWKLPANFKYINHTKYINDVILTTETSSIINKGASTISYLTYLDKLMTVPTILNAVESIAYSTMIRAYEKYNSKALKIEVLEVPGMESMWENDKTVIDIQKWIDNHMFNLVKRLVQCN